MSRIFDNGEGKLIIDESISNLVEGEEVGDIIYSHGIIVLNRV